MSTQDNVLVSTDKRLFYLSDNIDKNSMSKICYWLLYLIQDDDDKDKKEKDYKREPIKIYINSSGGYVYDSWALIDIMLNSKTPINTYCTGYAMSCGFNIFLAGQERFVGKNATLLYHQISGGAIGKYEDIKMEEKELSRLQEDCEKYILSRTKITQKRLDKVRTEKIDWYIHSDEVEGLGIGKLM